MRRLFAAWRTWVVLWALVALAVLGATAGCAEESTEKAYQVPRHLCGYSVDQNAVSRLLPAGREIQAHEKKPGINRERCQVNVDGKAALMVSQEWWKDGNSVVDVARGIPQVESAELGEDENRLLTGTGAVQPVECGSSGHPGHRLFVSVQVFGDGVDDSAAVEATVTAYGRAVKGAAVCR